MPIFAWQACFYPIPVTRIEPQHPLAMARLGSEAWLKTRFVIGKDGSLIAPIIAVPSGRCKSLLRSLTHFSSSWG